MQSKIYTIHPKYPERNKIERIAQRLREGAVMLYPTDTVYAIGCDPRNHAALERLRLVKPLTNNRFLTLLCPSLAQIATYAYVEDDAFKLMKALTPGPFTFVLKATKEIPRLVLSPKRKTVGLRVPDHRICQALLAELGFLLVSTSAKMPSGEEPESFYELMEAYDGRVDLIVDDDGEPGRTPSTVLDFTQPTFEVQREGLGMERLAPFLIESGKP